MAVEGVVEAPEQAGPGGPELPLGGEVPHLALIQLRLFERALPDLQEMVGA